MVFQAFLSMTLILLIIVVPFIPVSRFLFRTERAIVQVFMGISFNMATMILLLFFLSYFDLFTRNAFLIGYTGIVLVANGYALFRNGDLQRRLFPQLVRSLREMIRRVFMVRANTVRRHHLALTAIVIVAFYLRFHDVIVRSDYSNMDVYIHYNMTVDCSDGDPAQVFDPYNRGFHLFIIGVHWLTGESIYEVLRFMGPLLCTISVLAVYEFVREIQGTRSEDIRSEATRSEDTRAENTRPALFAALLYGCVAFGNTLLRRQTLSLSEAPVFILMPLALIFALRIASDLKEQRIISRNVAGFTVPAFLIAITHPISAMYFQYLIALFVFGSAFRYVLIHSWPMTQLLRKNGRRYCCSAALLLLIMPVSVYGYSMVSTEITGSSYVFQDASNDDADLLGTPGSLFRDIFSFHGKQGLQDEVSSAVLVGVCITTALSFLCTVYFIRNDPALSFLAASVGVMGFILLTGFGEPSMYRFRSSVYFIMFALTFWGVILHKVLGKLSQIFSSVPNVQDSLSFLADNGKTSSAGFALLFLILLAAAPFSSPGYTHLGYEDTISVSLDIVADYPGDQVSVFSSDFGSLREQQIIEAHNGCYMNLSSFNQLSTENRTANLTTYNFFIIEKEPYPLEVSIFDESGYARNRVTVAEEIRSREQVTERAVAWVEAYASSNGTVTIYFESDDILVYKIIR